MVYDRYGPPEVVRPEELPRPEPRAGDLLVRVRAASVTTADWRMRASEFPGATWLPGRIMLGLFRPRNRVLGVEFAGEVAALGAAVDGFAVGDRVVGFSGKGAHAEYLTMPATGCVTRTPDDLTDAEAVSLPFGGLTALVFLRDTARLRPDQSLLVVGASGGVGCHAVQIGKAMGARVTGIVSAANRDFVRTLGADEAYAYDDVEPFSAGGSFDIVLDTVGATTFAGAKPMLADGGVFIPLNFGLRDALLGLATRLGGGKRMAVNVSGDTKRDLEALLLLVAEKRLRPVIDRVFPLERIGDAYRYVEGRHRRGSVVLTVT